MVPFCASSDRIDVRMMARAAVSLLIFIFYNAVKSPMNKIGVVYKFKCENVLADKKFGRAAGKHRESVGSCSPVIVLELGTQASDSAATHGLGSCSAQSGTAPLSGSTAGSASVNAARARRRRCTPGAIFPPR